MFSAKGDGFGVEQLTHAIRIPKTCSSRATKSLFKRDDSTDCTDFG